MNRKPGAIAVLGARLSLLGALGLLTGSCGLFASSEAQTGPLGQERGDSGPASVETAIATESSLDEDLRFNGTTEPLERVFLRAQADGQLLRLAVGVGDTVSQGQTVGEVDSLILSSSVLEAESELSVRQAEVAQAESQVSNARTQVEQARVALQEAESNARRLRSLAEAGAISEQEAEAAENRVRTEQQAVRSAEEQVRSQQQAVSASQGRISSQQAIIAQNRERLSFSRLRAPINGVVMSTQASTGDLVQVGGDVLEIGDFSAVKVAVQVSELSLSQVFVGQPVQVSLDAFPDQTFSGRVARIAPVADAEGRQIPVEVQISNPEGRIGSGLRASVVFSQSAQQSVVVPEEALELDADGAEDVIFVLEENGDDEAVVRSRTVTIGTRDNGQVEIRDGLEPGEAFVRRSSSSLNDGDTVNLSFISES
jgi:HlyD family secretion protein